MFTLAYVAFISVIWCLPLWRFIACVFLVTLILKIVEPDSASRELFVILSQFLFQLDQGMQMKQALNAFLVASNIDLVSLEAKNSLEDYFLQLTSTY